MSGRIWKSLGVRWHDGRAIEAAYQLATLRGSDFDDETELKLNELVVYLFNEVRDYDWPGRQWEMSELGGGLKATIMFMPLPRDYTPPRYREQFN